MISQPLRKIVPAVLFAALLITVGTMVKGRPAAPMQEKTTQELWKKVVEAEKNGLPKTAADYLKQIAAMALQQKRYGESLRALTRQIILESVIKGNKPEYRVARLAKEMEKAPAEMKPMMKLIQAQWFWHYYSRNKWRFMNRTATEGFDEKDFTTWDLPKLFRTIDLLYREILKDETYLKKEALSSWKDLLIEGNRPSALRPTLFDFAVFEALDFYTSGEQSALPEDAFFIQADSDALAPAGQFLKYAPETTDVDSPKLQALRLFQKVMSFHLDDRDRDLFLDADLQRLRFVKNVAAGEGASDRYLARLKEIVEASPSSELSSLALYQMAQELYDREQSVEAYELADRGQKSHPSSLGASNCKALLARITAKEFELRCESVLGPGSPGKLGLEYRNISSLYIQVIKDDFSALLTRKDKESFLWPSNEFLRRVIEGTPAARWMASLKPTPDYKKKTAFLEIPPLKPGFYWIFAGFRENFSWDENKVQVASFWVSDLGLVTRGVAGGLQGYVVRNQTGSPLESAEVTLYNWNYDSSAFQKVGTVRTDSLGSFSLSLPDSYSNRVVLVRDGQGAELAEVEVPSSYSRTENPTAMCLFFTDRSLYRPGQMIFFKGICLNVDKAQNDYRLLPKQRARVAFRDVNRQEIANLDLVCNEFGSFSGTFVAPTDRLTGQMTISTESPRGSCSVRVEEYKRPKFQVKLDVPEREFRLNDQIALPGEAMAYTGAPVDGALVKYRVVREVQYPWWWFYWFSRSARGQSQEIAHGIMKTDETGKFIISFQAKPDPSVPTSSGPTFQYKAYVDVTDSAGETRSAQGGVRLGYASLEAGLGCRDWQETGKPVIISVTTTTLNYKKVAAKGTIEVFNLNGPEKPVPADLIGEVAYREQEVSKGKGFQGLSDTSDWKKWPEGRVAATKEFITSEKDDVPCTLPFDLKKGAYKAKLKTKDKFGTAVESFLYFIVLDPAEEKFPLKIPFFNASKDSTAEVGQTYETLWGTGHEKGPVLVEVFQNNAWLQRSWMPLQQTQGVLRVAVDERLRGGFTVAISMVKENRFYRSEQRVNVPWSNKVLDLSWLTFRSKLRPGQAETWSLQIKGPQATLRAAEMVATLYDASLDQFYRHGFPGMMGVFRTDWSYVASNFANRRHDLRTFVDRLNSYPSFISIVYVHFPPDIEEDAYGYAYPRAAREQLAASPASVEKAKDVEGKVLGGVVGGVLGGVVGEAEAKKAPEIDLSKVQARKNLNETAFFFPHLLTDKKGVVTLEFKMPEALTQWRFLGFAHTKDLESGSLEATAVTQKELMVQPNPPRFLREGDTLEFTVKVTNMADKEAEGAVELTFLDPITEKPLDAALGNRTKKLAFTIPAKQSRSFPWPVTVPDGLDLVSYKAVAATPGFSDGEEGVLPVLSRRLLVRESIPLWINDQGEKKFTFEKLVASAGSTTLQNMGLVVQMASNPAWYAVQALPFLMEFPYECSEQVFNRLYANSLAQKIANSDPKIRRIFDLWKGTEALKSNLEKNEDLKSVLLQESPWVLEAKAETQAKHNVGLLFDENRMSLEIKNALGKLANMQLSDGSWPWFPGGRGNSYITLYILTGFGRLKRLDVAAVSQAPAEKALRYLDAWILEVYGDIMRSGTQGQNHLSPVVALYLYGRSFYLTARPIPEASRKAVNYFLQQGSQYWLQLDCRLSQAHLALALKRFGDETTAQKIMRSMKERSQLDEELGRFWSELELSWWWYRAPIETQSVMIEAFDEVMNDQKAVEECKIWLLKQKQTQDWKTTKATADAVYGLILRGMDLLASDSIVEVSLAGKNIEPEKVEPGTGFYEKRIELEDIVPAMGNIVLKKADKGIAWGGVHWQYMEDISKITPHAQNPLRLKKSVSVQKLTKKGPVIEPVQAPLHVGDTLIIRIELRTNRDMEYIHLKDHRGSGLEPVNVLSQYKYQGGLYYYESTKDTATHFFIDYLPKGTYVFEYPLRVVHRGAYQNGLAHIECMYAPEFNSHSESQRLEVK